ncbi:hypothetical protein [Ruminococcus sp.]|jgi:hypothetical protein|uniref:hypothetical protein n=1 Tax=Ruminococcus sp. TaxID=41978 RepID=UPI0025FA8DB7|nr:hypothetical protein [Ruminococcus sp.]
MKKSNKIILMISIIGALACGISFGIALTKSDNMIAQIAFGSAAFFCLTTAVTAAKKGKI